MDEELNADDAVKFVESLLLGEEDGEEDTLEDPETLDDALRIVREIQAQRGDFCDRFAAISEILIAFTYVVHQQYTKTHDKQHKNMLEEIDRFGTFLADSHEAYHVFLIAIEKTNRRANDE